MLWVEAGVGVCILDSKIFLRNNPSVRFLNTDIISDPSLSLAWHRDNDNPLRGIFRKYFLRIRKMVNSSAMLNCYEKMSF